MNRANLNEIASILDEHIEKAEKSSLKKSITFDPTSIHSMTGESPYYNPYRNMGDGSFAPHDKSYWVAQGKKPEGYQETDKFYGIGRETGTNFRRSMNKQIDQIIKAQGFGGEANLGEIRQHADGTKWKKVREGMGLKNWELVSTPKGHKLEEHATGGSAKKTGAGRAGKKDEAGKQAGQADSGQVERIRAEIEKKKEAEKQEKTSKKNTISTVREAFGDDAPKGFHDKLNQMEKDVDIPKELQDKTKRREKGGGHEVHLNPDELGTLLSHGQYGFISAGKNPKLEKDMSPEEESKRYEELRKDLIERGYTFTKVVGHYEGEEDSFLIMSHEADREDILELGSKYNQDSIIYGEKGSQEVHFTAGENKGKVGLGKGWGEMPEADDYYSSLLTKEGEFKFQLNIDFENLEDWDDVREDEKKVAGGRTDPKKQFDPKSKFNDSKPNGTAETFKSERGSYLQERKKLHDEIISKRMDNVKPAKGSNKVAIFTGGGSGSGKTGVLKKAMENHSQDFVHVDSDDIKNDIPEYREMVKNKNEDAAKLAHKESSELASEIINRSIEESKPFVFDSTMKSPEKFEKMIDKLKKAGYEVHIFFADVPMDEAKKRCASREERTGRKVPDEIIEASHKGAISTLGKLYDKVDTSSVYTTTGDPPPKLVYFNNPSSNTKLVGDKDYYEDMKSRGHLIKSEGANDMDGTSQKGLYGKFINTINGLSSIGDHEDTDADMPDTEKRLKYESDKNDNGNEEK